MLRDTSPLSARPSARTVSYAVYPSPGTVPRLAGALWKRNNRGVWQQRWFVLEGSEIRYFESSDKAVSSRNAKGVINAHAVHSVLNTTHKDRDACFDIHCRGRTYHMAAQNEQERNEWTMALEAWIRLD